jgi:hypothetical protein
VFPLLNLTGFTVDTYSDQDSAFDVVKNENEQPYCFSINFETFDVENNDFKITYSWNKNSVPDTNLDDYNELILAPDISSWGLWFDNGGVSLYMYMTEFIARYKTDLTKIGAKEPLYAQQVGYAPLKSNEFLDISPIGI